MLLALILVSAGGFAQALNESANWPNAAWTITGSYATTATAFEADPTLTENFAFDDDDAGNPHEDNIAAESPVIDLTAAFNANEFGIQVSVMYGYRYLANDKLVFQYWDADGAAWIDWGGNVPNNSTTATDLFCAIPKTNFKTPVLDIQNFTPTQRAGFRYRISYDDDPNASDWNYGFCFESPVISSFSCASPTSIAVSAISGSGATISWDAIPGAVGYQYVIDNSDSAPASGTATTDLTYTASGLDAGTVYYAHVRTQCAAGFSEWTTVMFTTGPANDDCAGAIDLATMTSPIVDATTVNATNNNTSHCAWPSTTPVTNAAPDTYYFISVPDGSTLTIGQTANNYDSTNVVFYGDCDNQTIINCYDGSEFQNTVWANTTGSAQNVYFVQDGWNTGSGTFTLAWSLVACSNPAATYAVVSDCENSGGFMISVDVTDLGSAENLVATDDQNSVAQQVDGVGTYTFGPYTNGTNVVITLTNNQDSDCAISSAVLTQTVCPPNCATVEAITCNQEVPITLAGAGAWNVNACGFGTPGAEAMFSFTPAETGAYTFTIVSATGGYIDYYYKDASGTCDTTGWTCIDDNSIAGTDPMGTLEAGVTYLILADAEGTSSRTHTFKIDCLPTCTNAAATYTVVSDCDSGVDQFYVDVNLTDMGTAESITISDNQGNAQQNLTGTGTYQFGPYPNNTSVIYTVANDQDATCVLTSAAQTQNNCPVDCAQATVIANCGDLTELSITGNGAWNTGTCGFGTPGAEVIYSFTPAETGTYTLTITAATGGYVDYFWKEAGGTCDATGWTCIDDNNGPGSDLIGTLNAGTEYWILGDAESTTAKTATFKIDCLPTPAENDECDQAIALTVNPDYLCGAVTAGTLFGATDSGVTDNGAGMPDDDVWFSFVATTTSHRVSLTNVTGTPTDLVHEIMTGDCGALTSVLVSDANTSNPSGLVVDQTYYVRVFSYATGGTPTTNFNVCIGTPPPPPANDDCATPVTIIPAGTLAESAVEGTVVGATASAGIPTATCGGYVGGDVWYTVTVPDSGNLTIETTGAQSNNSFDSVIVVFSGTCDALTVVECDDDDAATGAFSIVSLTGRPAGEVLYVRVYEYNNDEVEPFAIGAYDASLAAPSFGMDSFKAYPNPVKDILNLSYAGNINKVDVYNLIGQQVLSREVSSNTAQLDMSPLSAGTYLVKVMVEGVVKTIKVIKE